MDSSQSSGDKQNTDVITVSGNNVLPMENGYYLAFNKTDEKQIISIEIFNLSGIKLDCANLLEMITANNVWNLTTHPHMKTNIKFSPTIWNDSGYVHNSGYITIKND